MFKISDWFKLILCTVLSSGVATAGNFGQMNFAYWKIPPVSGVTATYLVVAGGGGGGPAGGGGGAGGLLTGTSSLALGTTYTVTVGTGGSGGVGGSTLSNGSNGGNSIISGTGLTTITSTGGGGGGGAYDTSVPSGGSGGGASANGSVQTGGSGTSGQGYAGGSNGGVSGIPFPGGGGGGAGAVGSNGSSGGGGNGGAGLSNSITGSAVTYAGGGGGSSYTGAYSGGTGGTGGGGNGSAGGTGTAGTNGLGGGGGGSAYPNSGPTGGSGVVIISLPSGFAATTTGTVTVTTNGTNTVYTFTGSGTLIPRTGTPNYSNYFNGSSYFTVGNTATNFLCTGSTSGITATFEAWVYPTSYYTGGSSYDFSPISAKGGIYFNFGVSSGYLKFYWFSGALNTVQSANSTDIPLNTWTYVTMTINGSTIKMYINGVLNTTSATYTGVASAGAGTVDQIGTEQSGYLNFPGYISNYRLTNTVVYSSNFTPPTTQLTNITGTQLLTCQNSTLVDNSSNAYSITNTSVTTSPFAPF